MIHGSFWSFINGVAVLLLSIYLQLFIYFRLYFIEKFKNVADEEISEPEGLGIWVNLFPRA